MSCKYHTEREEVAKCQVCGASLCTECSKFQDKFGACFKCSKHLLTQLVSKIKQGLYINVFSLICIFAFSVMYIVDLSLGNLEKSFLIIGVIVSAVVLPLSITFLVYSAKNLKRYKKYLELIKD